MESFKEILKILPIPEKLKESIEILSIVKKHWEEILGEDLAKKMIPFKYENYTLVVEVPDFYHLQLLQTMESEVIKKLEKVINKSISLRIKINPKLAIKLETQPKFKDFTLPIIKKEIENICKTLNDPDLKRMFSRLLIKYFSPKKTNKN